MESGVPVEEAIAKVVNAIKEPSVDIETRGKYGHNVVGIPGPKTDDSP